MNSINQNRNNRIVTSLLTAILCASAFCTAACVNNAPVPPPAAGRSFYMGLTSFPYEYSYAALEYNYAHIGVSADLMAHHLDNGIPWVESLSGAAYPTSIMNDWQYRRDHCPSGHRRYVAITPINTNRNDLAGAWTAAGDNQPLTTPWSGYAFNHPSVKAAYLSYCRRIIAYFDPHYLAIGIEANLIRHNSPDKWSAYLELHQYVYATLKAENPSLVIMVSLTGIDLIEGYTGADHAGQMDALAGILPYTDYFALSIHPFCADFTSEVTVPPDFFDRIFALSSKPIAISETSYPAESFTLFSGSIVINGSEMKQNDYFNRLLDEAQAHDVRFVVNFLIRDYDTLWVQMGSPDTMLKLWRDTGFIDEAGNARAVMSMWLDRLSRPVQ